MKTRPLIQQTPDVAPYVVAAKNMRIELKAAFPGVKFSVRSSSYSMGNSVDVSWTDGPTTKQVEAIVNKYQQGHFNGMEDIYEYSAGFDRTHGAAKYVFASRTVSDELLGRVIAQLGEKFGGSFDGCPTPSVQSYRRGECFRAGWDRLINIELSQTPAAA